MTPQQAVVKKLGLRIWAYDGIPDYFKNKGQHATIVPVQGPGDHRFKILFAVGEPQNGQIPTDKTGVIDLNTLDLTGSQEAIEDHITKVLLPKFEAMWTK